MVSVSGRERACRRGAGRPAGCCGAVRGGGPGRRPEGPHGGRRQAALRPRAHCSVPTAAARGYQMASDNSEKPPELCCGSAETRHTACACAAPTDAPTQSAATHAHMGMHARTRPKRRHRVACVHGPSADSILANTDSGEAGPSPGAAPRGRPCALRRPWCRRASGCGRCWRPP